QPGDYTSFDPEMWPDGFEPARRRMEDLGMTPGLWLDTTGAAVAGWRPWSSREAEHGWAPWAESLDVHSNWSYCLFDGPYGDGLRRAMLHAVEQWGVGLFKFDFADFRAVSERCRHLDEGEVYRRNVQAFKEILRDVRRARRDVVYLAYNGFAHLPDYLGDTTSPAVPGVDPGWLDVVDYLYSGDPRPADQPCASLRRAVDLYQDHMVHKFHGSGIPLERIDDHGCMVGNTNTIYGLGKRGWRRTWLQSIGRGSRKAHFYGDVRLLEEDDVHFLRRARELFFGLFRQGAATRQVAPPDDPARGVPGWAPWHGFLTGDRARGLLVLVNPAPVPHEAQVPIAGLEAARVLFHDDGHRPACEVRAGRLAVHLAPEQMALVGLGELAGERHALGTNVGGDPVPAGARRIELPFSENGGAVSCRFAGSLLGAEEEGFDLLRLSFVLRQRGRAARRSIPRDQAPAEALPIGVEADGRSAEALRLVPDVPVWSGCSWVTGLYRLDQLRGAEQVRIGFRCPDGEVSAHADAWLVASDGARA
ncbi:MAG: hypothetical protein R6V05_05690, partial [Candidatus Brocadiia bacterium]